MSAFPGPIAVAPPTEQVREAVAEPEQLRKMSLGSGHQGVQQRLWGLDARLTKSVSFEEVTYWAKVERELEEEEYRRYKASVAGSGVLGSLKGYFTSNPYEDAKQQAADNPALQPATHDTEYIGEKGALASEDEGAVIKPIGPSAHSGDIDAEWRQAARAMRTAGWGGVFYLITTDILGWGQTPYVFSNTGYALGVGIFFLMGVAAAASGWMIWQTFIKMDSSRYPMLSFGDPFFRLFGPKTRHFINISQAFQMFLSVAIVLLGQTSIIAQLGGPADLCFVVAGIIALVVSMASGYMRSLKHLGWFCNASVWINVVTFIIVCVAAAKFGPDPTAQVSSGVLPIQWLKNPAPVKTFGGVPPVLYQPTDRNLFAAKFNGINSMVYAYSGAILFIAFLSEMRRPMDFWKAVFLAQAFITVVYIFFGVFCYAFYGQYAFSVITQVVQPLGIQIATNVLSLITGWLAIFLYFNVGMKVVYLEVGQEILGLPPITERQGQILWWCLGPVYWILAFIVAMSIPEFNAFTNFVGGLFSLNFTYSISGIMFLAYHVQDGARLDGEGFDPATGVTTRHDSGYKRHIRGFTKKWYYTFPALAYACGGLAASGMGTWAAVLALEAAFAGSVNSSWTCKNQFAS